MQNALQHTIARPVNCTGVGLHGGDKIQLTLKPAPEGHGIRFIRRDVSGFNPEIAADFRNVTSTNLGTTISNDEGTLVSTIEHLMAAFWGCNIDNAIVELDGPEVPIMDGSSEPFVFLIECAGVAEQKAQRKVIEVLKPISITEKDKSVSVEPAENFSVSLEIDFASKAIANQRGVFHSTDVSFKSDLCRARTFVSENEVDYLRSMGLAKGGSLDNAIVVSDSKVLNKDGLRYRDEFVRHKILDCIGDFYLAGGLIKGHFTGYRSGHTLNNKLLRAFFADTSAWRMATA